jgi:DNA modification methylase
VTPYYQDDGVTLWNADATHLPLEDESVDCIVTSPPYNCGMEYEGVSDSYYEDEYFDLVRFASAEMARVLKPGGRIWLNCLQALPIYDDLDALRRDKGTGRKGAAILDQRGDPFALWKNELLRFLKYRDTIVWVQEGGHDQATAWGSMLSPNAPNLRGRYEPILLAFKDTWSRGRVEKNDLTWEDFAAFTRNVWTFKSESAKRVGHPAPFPAEIPRRSILLSTWPGDVVLDPFCGSGTTIKVAKALGRKAIGVDLSPAYCEMTRRNVAQEVLAV